MAEFPALPLFTDAYLADTRHLSAAQHGAYLLLLMTSWRMGDCLLPDDDELLARFASMDKRTWLRNKAVVMAFWSLTTSGKWQQKRLLDERHYVEQLRSKKSAAGQASALKRKERGSTPVQQTGNRSGAPTPTPSKGEGKPSPPPYPPEFEQFWATFPKQRIGSRESAYTAWKKAIKRATEEEIYAGVQAYRGSDEVQRGFAAGAARWLNDDRWTTDYSAIAKHQLRTGSASLGKDTRDPARRAHDIGQEINRKRIEQWAAEDAARMGGCTTSGEQTGKTRIDDIALPDLREPEGLR